MSERVESLSVRSLNEQMICETYHDTLSRSWVSVPLPLLLVKGRTFECAFPLRSLIWAGLPEILWVTFVWFHP